MPDVPLSPLSLAAASGSPFSQQLAQCRSLLLHVFLLLALLPFLRHSWSSWEEQLRPGAPKGGRDGLLQAATNDSGLPRYSLLALLHPCRAGVTGTASCRARARSRGWESCNCNRSGFHAASKMDLRQLLEISGSGHVPVGSAPPAPGPLFAYLEP